MIHAIHGRQIDRYFAGLLSPAAVAAMFQRLWRCGACRSRYERHLLHERALPDGEARGQERLWRAIVASAGIEAHAATAARPAGDFQRRSFRLATLAGAGALAGLMLVVVDARLKRVPDPVARGAASVEATAPSMHLFRSVGEHHTEPVAETIRAGDGILFAYSNPGTDFSYLMVFALDTEGGVHWYYPAYEEPGQNPAAPAIRTHALGVELGEEIRHPLPVGPLRMFALFLRRPLRVEEVEGLVADAWRSGPRSVTALEKLPIQGGEQLSRLLDVRP